MNVVICPKCGSKHDLELNKKCPGCAVVKPKESKPRSNP